MFTKKKKSRNAVVELFILIDDEQVRRNLFELLYYLEDEYVTVLAVELRRLLLTGKETVWVNSRLMLRFYSIAKRLLGFPEEEADFDLQFYHEIERYHNGDDAK